MFKNIETSDLYSAEYLVLEYEAMCEVLGVEPTFKSFKSWIRTGQESKKKESEQV